MLGVRSEGFEELKRYSLTSLKENVSKIDDELLEEISVEGWRKSVYWKRSLKNLSRAIGRISGGGGKQKEKRIKQEVKKYLTKARIIKEKLSKSKEEMLSQAKSIKIIALLEGL